MPASSPPWAVSADSAPFCCQRTFPTAPSTPPPHHPASRHFVHQALGAWPVPSCLDCEFPREAGLPSDRPPRPVVLSKTRSLLLLERTQGFSRRVRRARCGKPPSCFAAAFQLTLDRRPWLWGGVRRAGWYSESPEGASSGSERPSPESSCCFNFSHNI